MINVKKIGWVIRYAIISIFNRGMKMPGYIGKPTFVSSYKDMSMGKHVRIYPGLRSETSNNGRVIYGDNVSIGQNFHVVSQNESLYIGNNVVISGNVMISNCDHDYRKIDEYLYDQPMICDTTHIGDDCFIGYGAVILSGTELGRHCIVGANSVVRGKYPDYCVLAGSPAKMVKKYNFNTGEWERR